MVNQKQVLPDHILHTRWYSIIPSNSVKCNPRPALSTTDGFQVYLLLSVAEISETERTRTAKIDTRLKQATSMNPQLEVTLS